MKKKQHDAAWYDPVPLSPDLYRDAYCNEHGDTEAIYRDDAWRCTVCGAEVEAQEAQP